MDYFKELSPPVKIFIAFLLLGTIFKLQHWPFAVEIIVLSTALIAVFYLAQFLKKLNKEIVDYFKVIGVTLACLYWIFNILHFPYRLPLLIGAFIMYIIVLLIRTDNQNEKQDFK